MEVISLYNHCLTSCPQEQDTGWLTSRAPWFCLPRASWETRLEVWVKTKARTPEWTVPFFKCHACKTFRNVSAMSTIAASFRVPAVSFLCLSLLLRCGVFSGKAIPNGTDKHQLGTPENEGKLCTCPFFAGKLY